MRKITALIGLTVFAVVASLAAAKEGGKPMPVTIQRKVCLAPDGVSIAYSTAGAGAVALVFIHGGLADRTFFDGQLTAFARDHQVIALDLAGHGESGANRLKWGMKEFGADVRAAVEAEKPERVILFGNSLGGPVAVEAARQMPGRVLGVVGIDTFQRLDYIFPPEEARRQAEAFLADYPGSVRAMLKALFHPDADPAVVADAGRRMQHTPPAAAHAMFLGLAGYDLAAAVQDLKAPLRAINGDLYPTDIRGNRKIKADFDAVIMTHTGHYPMLEQPDEFNRHVMDMVRKLKHK